jgi:hypothetical protein
MGREGDGETGRQGEKEESMGGEVAGLHQFQSKLSADSSLGLPFDKNATKLVCPLNDLVAFSSY